MIRILTYFFLFLFFAAFSVFFYLNIKAIADKYNKVKKRYFSETDSIFKQIKYFSVTEGNLNRVNVISAFLFGILGFNLKIGVLGPIFGFIVGWFLPKGIIKHVRKKYLLKMQDQLFSSLILLGNAVKAGETLPQAFSSIRSIVGDPISQEFEILLQQMRVGMTMEDALLDMEKRIPLEDLSLSVQAMIISIKTGANLPLALKKIADTIQQRNLFYKKLSAITAQGRTQGIMVGLLPFAIGFLLYLNDHSFIEVLFKTFIGNCVIAVMIVLEVLAFFSIKRICAVKF